MDDLAVVEKDEDAPGLRIFLRLCGGREGGVEVAGYLHGRVS